MVNFTQKVEKVKPILGESFLVVIYFWGWFPFKISSKVKSPFLSSKIERYFPILTDFVLSSNTSVLAFTEKDPSTKKMLQMINFIRVKMLFLILTFSEFSSKNKIK